MSEDEVRSLITVCETGKCTDLSPQQAAAAASYFASLKGSRGGGLTSFRIGEDIRFGDGFFETKQEVVVEFRFKTGWLEVFARKLSRDLEEMTKTPAAVS